MRKAMLLSAILLGMLSAGLTGCASSPKGENPQADNGKDEKVVCRKVAPVGTHRKRTICKSVRDIDQERKAGQSTIRNTQRGTVSGGGRN